MTFPLAHLGFPLILADIFGQILIQDGKATTKSNIPNKTWSNGLFNPTALGLGCVLPDIVDKTFSQIVFSSGRALGHTFLFSIVCSIPFLVIYSKKTGFSLSIGVLSHLLLDSTGELPWFWPLYPKSFTTTENALNHLDWILDPLTLSLEILGLACLFYLYTKYKCEIHDYIGKITDYSIHTSIRN